MTERTHYMPVEAQGLSEEMSQQLELGAIEAESMAHFTPEFVGTQTQELDVNDVLREIGLAQRTFEKARLSQAEGTVKINTEHPIHKS